MTRRTSPNSLTNSPLAVDCRGLTPVATVLLVALATVLAGAVAGTSALTSADHLGDSPPSASLSLSASERVLTIDHRGGAVLDAESIALTIAVNDEALEKQPRIPYFSQAGFTSGPTGPFNHAGGTTWRAGEAATLEIAGTNEPVPEPGDTVSVRLTVDGRPIANLEATVQ